MIKVQRTAAMVCFRPIADIVLRPNLRAMGKAVQRMMLVGALLAGACAERSVPEIERAAAFCGVSYSAMRDAYLNSTAPSRSPRTQVLGRCEINKDMGGRVSTRILKR